MATPPRSSPATATGEVVERFSEAFNRHDVDAVMALSTHDTVLETTLPAPDGRRHVGQAAVRGYWEAFFRASPHAHFETEETIVTGDRCVVRWIYRWIGPDGAPGHVRGVDVFRVRDGKVSEKLVYVKG